MPDPALSSLLFPDASRSISAFHRASARQKLSLRSRLHSIAHDAAFVTQVAALTGLPVVANERCGSWYVRPSLKRAGVYFKSTDGHHGEWSFSRRRLNVPLLQIVEGEGGAVLVDSTRRGKTVPDALSKTVPIWCAVWNSLLFPGRGEVRTPRSAVGESEHAQIEARLEGWVEELRALDVKGVTLGKPMRPLWVTQGTMEGLEDELQAAREQGMYPVVLCTASGSDALDKSHVGYDYVQGAADDEEAWALGLKAPMFWAHADELLAANEDDLPGLIAEIVDAAGKSGSARKDILIKPTTSLWIGTEAADEDAWDVVVDLRHQSAPVAQASDKDGDQPAEMRTIRSPLQAGKLGSRALRVVLPGILETVEHRLMSKPNSKVLVICDTGKDFSLGVTLAMLCLYISDDGSTLPQTRTSGITKDFIKHRLGWIMVCIPDANPSRATLQSVNAVLLG